MQTEKIDQQAALSQDNFPRPSWTLQIIGPGCPQAKLSTDRATLLRAMTSALVCRPLIQG